MYFFTNSLHLQLPTVISGYFSGHRHVLQIVGAVSFQIIPADTQYVEVPLAAVDSIYRHKGIGHLIYLEMRKRLEDVGVHSILCWADEESEGFWLKQVPKSWSFLVDLGAVSFRFNELNELLIDISFVAKFFILDDEVEPWAAKLLMRYYIVDECK
ncbi:hypothetical protein L2E82_20513 [Cichorium intybus]|uniref:Uncharacterized protein n=1 Tax=Cichorium intybus TaxID=13427 RepID=A0ACB9DTU5_CICIN|nr:hypothetical protein L2E82_20513 [Cichorium intybus]